MNKRYTESYCVRKLSEKASISINTNEKLIQVQKDAGDVGNGSWGKIDYLHKVHGYTYLFVTRVTKKLFTKEHNNEDYVSSKTVKKEAKLNMANMARSAMKRVKSK